MMELRDTKACFYIMDIFISILKQNYHFPDITIVRDWN